MPRQPPLFNPQNNYTAARVTDFESEKSRIFNGLYRKIANNDRFLMIEDMGVARLKLMGGQLFKIDIQRCF